mgnify:CR=1 FL=1|jgi:hypothetical protein
MNMPTSVTETIFKEVLKTTISELPIGPSISIPKVAPSVPTNLVAVSPNVALPPSGSSYIKPKHILIGIAVVGGLYLFYKWNQKRKEELEGE